MTSRWRWVVRLLLRRIWFRAALFSIFSVGLALLAAFIAPFVPYDISTKIGSDAVDQILEILASSMLAVTTFSLTAMVSAFSGASSTITPRATQLLVQDATAQNALSTFLGAFLFSIVGICALSTGIYGKSGRVILFVGTIMVIAIIVFTLLRWIEHLSSFGRVGNTIERVERAAKGAVERSAFALRVASPRPALAEPAGRKVLADKMGYVTHIDISTIAGLAADADGTIDVLVTPGAFVTPERGLVRWRGDGGEDDEAVRDAFTIEHHRQFDHDPRFGLIVLSEIASRALSPSVNDPGTAIAVLGAGVRVMTAFLGELEDSEETRPGSVTLPDLLLPDLLDDLIRPIARDGAGVVEVAMRLQRSLGEIAQMAPRAHKALALSAADALDRSEHAMTYAPDLARLRGVYREYWNGIPATEPVDPDKGRSADVFP